MKNFFLLFLLSLVGIGGFAQSLKTEGVLTWDFSRGGSPSHGVGAPGFGFIGGKTTMLFAYKALRAVNGVSGSNGTFFFDGNTATAASIGTKSGATFVADTTLWPSGAVNIGAPGNARLVFGTFAWNALIGGWDSAFIAVNSSETDPHFVRIPFTYVHKNTRQDNSSNLWDAKWIGDSKVFFGGGASIVNGHACPYSFILDTKTNEVDTLGGFTDPNAPLAPIRQVVLSPDGKKVVCLVDQYGATQHIYSWLINQRKWQPENEFSNVEISYIWYHRGDLYASAQYLEFDTSCHSLSPGGWAYQNQTGWHHVCVYYGTSSNDDIGAAIDTRPDSVLVLGLNKIASYSDWNTTLTSIPDTSYGFNGVGADTFKGKTYLVYGAGGVGIGRLVSIQGVLLPLTWKSFTATVEKNAVLLKWQIGDALNNDHFIVERSSDGTTFKNVGVVSATASTAYQFVDANLPAGMMYYRIAEVDKDGHTYLSPTKAISITEASQAHLWPNPAHGNLFYSENVAFLQIISSVGQVIRTIENYQQGTSINIGGLSPGIYFLRDALGNRKTFLIQ